MRDKELETLADQANASGDNSLAIVLYTFLGAKNAHMDKELAIHCQNWARQRVKELEMLNNNKNN